MGAVHKLPTSAFVAQVLKRYCLIAVFYVLDWSEYNIICVLYVQYCDNIVTVPGCQ